MPKRGARLPWKVDYVWEESQIKGRIACYDEDEARYKAEQIEHNAELRELNVSITITHEERAR